ncbi:unnamed protein product [Pleuronectes platessa]|uniref:Uncharacterized protein n=1 Tax=Pleuronectes platessa TaxID=8262 RepID=A0A9N7YGC2_PLEPL|nr:unnamed protein product [Pleuronectes platessa]
MRKVSKEEVELVALGECFSGLVPELHCPTHSGSDQPTGQEARAGFRERRGGGAGTERRRDYRGQRGEWTGDREEERGQRGGETTGDREESGPGTERRRSRDREEERLPGTERRVDRGQRGEWTGDREEERLPGTERRVDRGQRGGGAGTERRVDRGQGGGGAGTERKRDYRGQRGEWTGDIVVTGPGTDRVYSASLGDELLPGTCTLSGAQFQRSFGGTRPGCGASCTGQPLTQ